jgi:predicted MFS family arabinose efflux permease
VRPLAASLLGRIPDSVLSISLVLLVHQATGSYATAGLAAAGYGLGSAVGAPIVGRALDRLGQRRVLIATALIFAAGLIAIAETAGRDTSTLTIVLATVAGVTRPPLESAMRALWVTLVSATQLPVAYALDATLQELVWILGPLLLSALLLISGPVTVLLACALLSLLGNVGYSMGPAVGGDQVSVVSAGGARLGSVAFLSLLVAGGLYGVAVGALIIALTAFCAQHHAQPTVGLLIAIWGAGSIAGGVAYGSRSWTGPPAQRALALLGALAIILALLNLADSVLILALLMFALGIPLSPWLGTLNSALQELIPTERAAEGFTWSFATITTGTAVGNAAAGPLTPNHLGFTFAATAAAAGAALGIVGHRLSRTPPEPAQAER